MDAPSSVVTANNDTFVVDKNLGRKLVLEPGDLPETNADGDPVVEPTQEQKYLFDTRGWLLVPGLLDRAEVGAMRDFALRVRRQPESPSRGRSLLRCRAAGKAHRPPGGHRLPQRIFSPPPSFESLLLRIPHGGQRSPRPRFHARQGRHLQAAQRQRVFPLRGGLPPLPVHTGQGIQRPDPGGMGTGAGKEGVRGEPCLPLEATRPPTLLRRRSGIPTLKCGTPTNAPPDRFCSSPKRWLTAPPRGPTRRTVGWRFSTSTTALARAGATGNPPGSW